MVVQNNIDAIRKIIRIINGAWINNRLEYLNEYFDDNMIIITSDYKKYAEGKEACINSYKHFTESAKTLSYIQGEPVIKYWGNTAVAVYNFEINYEIKGKAFNEKGEDIFVFNRKDEEDNYWKAVWRRVSVFNL